MNLLSLYACILAQTSAAWVIEIGTPAQGCLSERSTNLAEHKNTNDQDSTTSYTESTSISSSCSPGQSAYSVSRVCNINNSGSNYAVDCQVTFNAQYSNTGASALIFDSCNFAWGGSFSCASGVSVSNTYDYQCSDSNCAMTMNIAYTATIQDGPDVSPIVSFL
ncbi:hypothetical protein HDU83_007205 [Entophlyctis luteolus]|nr:hypothetical protein HDU83_007205 [Entophlyctis luteolus]